MILILSIHNDQDTQLVIDWLKFRNQDFLRVNDDELMTGVTEFQYQVGSSDSSFFKKNGRRIYLRDINVVWFRKFRFLYSFKDEEHDLKKYIKSESIVLCEVIFDFLAHKKWLFKHRLKVNKIETLELAAKVGLDIPKSAILTNKATLRKYLARSKDGIISKALKEGDHIVDSRNFHYSMFTVQINNLDSIPEYFGPSFVQDYIDKEYELRSFFLDGRFWTMAIFSQNNEKTRIDFRNYDKELPNRTEPYLLPVNIKSKLTKLMKNLKLNTGSIDLIKAKDGRYIFLEVNPSGQFGMTAFPCNYPLHKEVADYLIKQNKKAEYDNV